MCFLFDCQSNNPALKEREEEGAGKKISSTKPRSSKNHRTATLSDANSGMCAQVTSIYLANFITLNLFIYHQSHHMCCILPVFQRQK